MKTQHTNECDILRRGIIQGKTWQPALRAIKKGRTNDMTVGCAAESCDEMMVHVESGGKESRSV